MRRCFATQMDEHSFSLFELNCLEMVPLSLWDVRKFAKNFLPTFARTPKVITLVRLHTLFNPQGDTQVN